MNRLTANLPPPPHQQAPLLRVCLFLILGIRLAWQLRETTTGFMWLVSAVISLLLTIGLWKRINIQKGWTAYFACICIALTGGSLLQIEYESTQTSWPSYATTWKAEILSINKRKENAVQADLSIKNKGYEKRIVRSYLKGKQSQKLSPGQTVHFKSRIKEPQESGNPGDFNYKTYLITHGISGTTYCTDSVWGQQPLAIKHFSLSKLLYYRGLLVEKYARHIRSDGLGILAAMTLGDKSILSSEIRELFSYTGTSHILALSGLHLGILFSIFNIFIFRWIKRQWTFCLVNIFALSAFWIFALLAGHPLSLVRATSMFTIMQLCKCMRRESNSLNNLALTAILMLTYSPLSLFDVGFQLSFAAVFSILLFMQYIWPYIRMPKLNERSMLEEVEMKQVKDGLISPPKRSVKMLRTVEFFFYNLVSRYIYPFLCISVCAQLGTMPFVLYYFHYISPYGLLANFIAVPSAYLILCASVLFFFLPFAQQWIASFINFVLDVMTTTLSWITKIPGAVLEFYPSWITLLAFVCILYLLILFISRRKRIYVYLSAALVVFSGCWECYQIHPTRINPQIIIYNISKADVIHCICSANQSYIYSTASNASISQHLQYISKNFWKAKHISLPQRLTQETRASSIQLRENCILFGNKRVILQSRNLPIFQSKTISPLEVDILVVGKGCFNKLPQLLNMYTPKQIVLAASLPDYYKNRLMQECKEVGLSCYDISSEGAFIQSL